KSVARIGVLFALVVMVGFSQAASDGQASADTASNNPAVFFIGTLSSFVQGNAPGAQSYWLVHVNEVQSGPRTISSRVKVITSQAISPPWGKVDAGLKADSKVWVAGAIVAGSMGREITLHGSEDFYLLKAPPEIRLRGKALEFHKPSGIGGSSYWTVKVDSVLSGPRPCSREINVATFAPISSIPWGRVSKNIKPGDEVEVSGIYQARGGLVPGKCSIWTYGSKKYYLKKVPKIWQEANVAIISLL
ncbi:MAG TPA: hypothetical protein VN455_09300, partial [Methanotrichaceae archaeon]|nr:hypothetical protein [Methanotrichaceae archaeon]